VLVALLPSPSVLDGSHFHVKHGRRLFADSGSGLFVAGSQTLMLWDVHSRSVGESVLGKRLLNRLVATSSSCSWRARPSRNGCTYCTRVGSAPGATGPNDDFSRLAGYAALCSSSSAKQRNDELRSSIGTSGRLCILSSGALCPQSWTWPSA